MGADKLLEKSCLKQHFSLRRQLLTSFGSSAFITLTLVVVISIIMLNRAGDLVKDRAGSVMRDQIHASLVETTISTAEMFAKFQTNYDGLVQQIAEVTLDRIVNYPRAGWEQDLFVPFVDTDSSKNVYPLEMEPVPLDWQVNPDITAENAPHVIPGREHWLETVSDEFTYITASFFLQGVCDPTVTDTHSKKYYPGCTNANNNMTTGGAVKPTSIAKGLYDKSGELGVLLRPIYEANHDVFFAGIYFFNAGAGANLVYPGHLYHGQSVYESIGCEWLQQENPRTKKPFATSTEIAQCHPQGTVVSGREYNAAEREWFREAVLHSGDVIWHGPYEPACTPVAIMTVAKAVFDRRTGELIGVVTIDIGMPDLNSKLADSRLYNHSEWAVLSIDDGMVISDSLHSTSFLNHSDHSDLVDGHGGELSVTWQSLGILSDMAFDGLKNTYLELFLRSDWDEASLAAAAAASVHPCPYGVASAFPLPIPPKKFEDDPTYFPHTLAVQVISDDAYTTVEDFEGSIDSDILFGSLAAIGVGLFGMFVILVILWCVARAITKPLLWMELVSWRIVNHGDKRSGDALRVDDDEDLSATVRCSPRTEITELVEEFRSMITGFSGEGSSAVAECDPNEVRNTMTWQSDFQHLYSKAWMQNKSAHSGITNHTPETEQDTSSGKDSKGIDDEGNKNKNKSNNNSEKNDIEAPNRIEFIVEDDRSGNDEAQIDLTPAGSVADSKATRYVSKMVCPAPPKQHVGPVAARLPEDRPTEGEKTQKAYRSRLFCWIVVLIVVPLMITNVVITSIVTNLIISAVPAWVDDMREESLELEIAAKTSIIKSKASQLSMILNEQIRDLYWQTRLAGWLHFDAVKRADSFTRLLAASEQCKVHESEMCPVYDTKPYDCPCEWNDVRVVGNCTHETQQNDLRRLQQRFYGVLAQDYDPITGARQNASSYNATAYSPETTLWQNNISQLPGSSKGRNASGFHTTYDRLRVSSALAVVDFPVYNYQNALGRRRQVLGSYLAFEADGILTGYSGCSQIHTGFARFQSDDDNRAFEVNELLCPRGKYGFDPRCRNWYNSSRDKFLTSKEMLHITAPYEFAFDGSIGLSATTPVANVATGEFGGVMLYDFPRRGLWDALDSLASPILSYLITPGEDVYGGDTVIGPEKNKPWSPALITDELFQFDNGTSQERSEFEVNILAPMKMGQYGMGRFSRHNSKGGLCKLITVYAPVIQLVVYASDPSNLAEGVNATQKTVYSVGISVYEKDLGQTFEEIENDMFSDLDRLALIDSVLVLFLTLVFLVIACEITIHVTRPMIVLLRAVQSINSKEAKRDIPPLKGGSREVHQVYNSFSKLYKVVRIANTAFFSGNLVWANHIVNDAIQLFRKINDKKAIGIACNNLGNIMFARIMELGKESESSLNYGFAECAYDNYNEAVALSEGDFETAESVEEKASYAQELADRLFNRGLFLLFMDGEADAPEKSREKALDDISRARDLDYDVKEFHIENKLLLQYSDCCFSRTLRRLHGLCSHCGDEEVQNVWEASRLLEEADELLFAAWNEKTAPLFRSISRTGRLQQLEAAAIRIEAFKGNHAEAARIGMRMFTEDEYLLELPFAIASTALLHFAQGGENAPTWSPKTLTSVRSDLRKMSRLCRSPTLDLGKCVVFALELNERLEGESIFPLINSKCMNLFEKHCTDEDYVGMVSYTVSGDHTLELSSKVDNGERQKNVLNLATSSTSERVCSALPFAMQVILDSSVAQEMDTYLLLFTDGYSWDSGPYLAIKNQLSQMNKENGSNIHLIILGLDVEPEHIDECKAMCAISKESLFVELTMENIDETFSFLSSVFSAGRLYQEFLSTITMEKF